jgi:tellurite methyltransferase
MRAVLTLQQHFGPIDIYLFEQLLRGNIAPGMSILDAGCGYGRNLVYLLREGYTVSAVDANPEAIAELRQLAHALAPRLPAENFRVEPIESMTFASASFDVVLLNAVLHFARDDAHFEAMLHSAWRTLKPGGILFCRLASTIGMEREHQQIAGHRFLAPDGAERYAVDEALLLQLTKSLGGELLDPLKTTVVQGQRCMTTWVLRKD